MITKELPKAVVGIFYAEGKIFTIKRQNYLRVFPGYTSFPGGKVDKSDHEVKEDYFLFKKLKSENIELLNGLERELYEELEFDSAVFEHCKIKKLGVAITPEFNPYRFITHFYVLHFTHEFDVRALKGEAEKFGWADVDEVLNDYERGDLLAVPPTIKAIQVLANEWNGKEVSLDLTYDSETEVPMIESVYGVKQFLPLSNTFPPAYRTNCFLIGDSPNVLIDPSPKNEAEFKKLLKSLSYYKVDKIFLSHHHPDHHEFAVSLARELNVSIMLSRTCYDLILKKFSLDYFEDISLEFIAPGDCVTTYFGEPVIALDHPGHASGQLGLAPTHYKWIFVSDLIQTVGTVLVGGEASSMAEYFQSLESVIATDANVVFPSHGIGLGGVAKVKKTLDHRKMREDSIRELLGKGKSVEEIYQIIYFALDDRLKKYAISTINSHIEKINADQ